MFLFSSCCQAAQSNIVYKVIKKNYNKQDTIQYVNEFNNIKQEDLKNPQISILTIQKSDYQALMKQYKGTGKQFTDPHFPPNQYSLGKIQGVSSSKWKRISQIITKKPVIFDGYIQPKDVIQGNLGDCYFLSALASLAEDQKFIKRLFENQQYNVQGIYKILLRIDGVIQEIVIDDYIPVNSEQQPLFCQPNKNEIWVLLLQKAWAKANGSYANIVAGSPTQVFKAVTYAPSQLIIVKQDQQQQQKLWRRIVEHSIKNYPCCCGTSFSETINWVSLGLSPSHAYTLLDAVNLKDLDKNNQRMLKIRNPWGKTEWNGKGSENDEQFWRNITPSSEKSKFILQTQKKNDGIFFMLYEDFCKYFSQIHFCMIEPNANYFTQVFYPNKNGSLYEVEIKQEYQYIFELHQSGIRGQQSKRASEGCSRATLLLVKRIINGQKQDFEFINGALKYNQEDATLKVHLFPGKYLLYAKLDPTPKLNILPQKASVSVYSSQFTLLKISNQQKYPSLLKKVFINHGRLNKRQNYQGDLMWIAYKLLFQQGGYAYVVFGNNQKSKHKFVVTIDQSSFTENSFILKKPYKGKGQGQRFQVYPGQQKIILARVSKNQVKALKFPPKMGIKVEKFEKANN